MNLEEIRYAVKYYYMPAGMIFDDVTMNNLENDEVWREAMNRDKAIDNLEHEFDKFMKPIADSITKATNEVSRVLGGK